MSEIEHLEEQLVEAYARKDRAETGPGWDEYFAALASVQEIECAIARAKGEDYAVVIDIGCVPEMTQPGPVVVQGPYRLAFAFYAMRIRPDRMKEDAGLTIVHVDSCMCSKCGPPNDEARVGHRLYNRGFKGAAVYELHDSRWLEKIAEENRVKFPDTGPSRWGCRHFIFPFKEVCLEILRTDLRVSPTRDWQSVATRKLASWVRAES